LTKYKFLSVNFQNLSKYRVDLNTLQDEVLAISEKVVLRVEDLLDRIVEDVSWCRGLEAVWEKDCLLYTSVSEDAKSQSRMLVDSALDFQDVLREREQIGKKESLQLVSSTGW
jgi:hypothetical protein